MNYSRAHTSETPNLLITTDLFSLLTEHIKMSPEAHDLEAINSGSDVGFFEFKISLFGCNVASAFSRACSFDLIFVHIWA